MVREANKGVRLEWAKEMLKNSEQFDDVIFTDESTFQVDYHARRAYRRVREPRVMRTKPKHPVKVHVWGVYQREERLRWRVRYYNNGLFIAIYTAMM